jgi:hypothetical protein
MARWLPTIRALVEPGYGAVWAVTSFVAMVTLIVHHVGTALPVLLTKCPVRGAGQ